MAEERPPPEDSLRHLRCRGMTSQSFALEMPILTCVRWHDGVNTYGMTGEPHMAWHGMAWQGEGTYITEQLKAHISRIKVTLCTLCYSIIADKCVSL